MWFSELRCAIRSLLRHRAYTAVAIGTIAIGIGANTFVFSLVTAVLRPLPYPEADELAVIFETMHRRNVDRMQVSAADLNDFKTRSSVFEDIAPFRSVAVVLTGSGDPEHLNTCRCSARVFSLLRTQPGLGRVFTDSESQPGGERVVILSDRLWKLRFGADPTVIGRAVSLDGELYSVIGVMPPNFLFPEFAGRADLWLPLVLPQEDLSERRARNLFAVGRLLSRYSFRDATDSLREVARSLEREHPGDNRGVGVSVVPLHQEVRGDDATSVLLLWMAVSFLLAISIANLSNLFLARALAQRNDSAIRVALGAGRFQLWVNFASEAVVVALSGSAIGTILAYFATAAIARIAPARFLTLYDIRITPVVLLFAVLLALAIAVLLATAAALYTGGAEADSIRLATRGRLRAALVVVEIAFTVVLLVASSLMIRTLHSFWSQSLGFNSGSVLTVGLNLPSQRYSSADAQVNFYRQLVERTRSLPGVKSASLASSVPFMGSIKVTAEVSHSGTGAAEATGEVIVVRVSQGYFSTLEIPFLSGKDFSDGITHPVAIVSESAARKYWASPNALGQRINLRFGNLKGWREVIGVVGDVRPRGFKATPQPTVYVPVYQAPIATMRVLAKTQGSPHQLLPSLRRQVSSVDPLQPLAGEMTLDDILWESISQQRLVGLLLAVFTAIAIVFATVGVYGTISYSVAQRRAEFGIRLALGAEYRQIQWLLMCDSMRVVLLGVGCGVLGAAMATRLISNLLYGVGPRDIGIFLLSSALVAASGAMAAYGATRKLRRLEPSEILRQP